MIGALAISRSRITLADSQRLIRNVDSEHDLKTRVTGPNPWDSNDAERTVWS